MAGPRIGDGRGPPASPSTFTGWGTLCQTSIEPRVPLTAYNLHVGSCLVGAAWWGLGRGPGGGPASPGAPAGCIGPSLPLPVAGSLARCSLGSAPADAEGPSPEWPPLCTHALPAPCKPATETPVRVSQCLPTLPHLQLPGVSALCPSPLSPRPRPKWASPPLFHQVQVLSLTGPRIYISGQVYPPSHGLHVFTWGSGRHGPLNMPNTKHLISIKPAPLPFTYLGNGRSVAERAAFWC